MLELKRFDSKIRFERKRRIRRSYNKNSSAAVGPENDETRTSCTVRAMLVHVARKIKNLPIYIFRCVKIIIVFCTYYSFKTKRKHADIQTKVCVKGRSHCVRLRTTMYMIADVVLVVRPRIYYVSRLVYTNNKMATEDDSYDVVLASSIVIFTRLTNFLVVEIDKLDLDDSGFTTCCVVEMTWVNMPDSYKNIRSTVTASTDTFGCQQSSLTMFWGWWDHTFHVYQLCTWLCTCMCRDVRRRTQCGCRLIPLSCGRPSVLFSTKKVKVCIAINGETISELRDVTCHNGVTQCYLPPDTSERAPSYP